MARPNILWIITTQWRAQACGYMGDPNARTPHLDALAANAINFSQAVTPHPFGPFARAALLTGKPSPENGVRDYFDPLPTDARTLAHAMNELNYATAFFGKWHLARRDPEASLVGEAHAKMIVPPEARGGFAFWEGFESGFLLNDPWLHGTREHAPIQVRGYQSDVVAARAASWMSDASGAKPWFCVVSLEPPHPPYDVPAAGVAPYDSNQLKLPPNVPRGTEIERKARRELAGYYAHIEATDRAIGRIVAAAGDDTIVVFTSVHGDMHGAHGLFRKGWPHDESVRVPLLIRGRRTEDRGRNEPCPISLVDLPRLTLAEIENREWKIEDKPARISMPSVVALPHQCDRAWSGFRTENLKLVLNADSSPWLFFDLANDPFEMNNLVGDPAQAVRIHKCRDLFLAQHRVTA
jgi:arylsulfatase A-like enzyme